MYTRRYHSGNLQDESVIEQSYKEVVFDVAVNVNRLITELKIAFTSGQSNFRQRILKTT